MPMLLDFLYDQLFTSLPIPQTSFSGQTIIVTGSNVGLGLEAARHFTRLAAAKVILAVRSLEKGEAAKKSIEESTQRTGVVEVWQLDLSSYESVKQFAKRAEGLSRLDAIVENAGIATHTYRVLEDNEATITTNVVSTFLLALMILPKLRETASKFNVTPHLVIVSSEVHAFTSFSEKSSANIFKTLNDKETANMRDRYNVSKLLEVFYTRELAARTKANKKSDVIINFVNPGLCHSELAREAGWGLYILKLLLARTTEYGSRTLVNAVEAGQESHGQYMSNCTPSRVAPLVTSAEGVKAQKQVWEELSAKLEKIQPGIMQNV
ncbi:short-chain dehydrogenase [Lasallia pustulata]|uniref:Short-chain dehydrogenase n=1 Tax=Lasallia pustulata TaxID=136370 RepID=A0A1W5CV75_9LECA|nr:short-chain dehydrogenase [Lasallia pustulata]